VFVLRDTVTRAAEAEAAGADEVGSDDMIAASREGGRDVTQEIAQRRTANWPTGSARLIARILGPRGLMPKPKTGTVTPAVANGDHLRSRSARSISMWTSRQPALVIGKVRFVTTTAGRREPTRPRWTMGFRAKPSAAKGRYLKKVTFSHHHGPRIPVDTNRTRKLLVGRRHHV